MKKNLIGLITSFITLAIIFLVAEFSHQSAPPQQLGSTLTTSVEGRIIDRNLTDCVQGSFDGNDRDYRGGLDCSVMLAEQYLRFAQEAKKIAPDDLEKLDFSSGDPISGWKINTSGSRYKEQSKYIFPKGSFEEKNIQRQVKFLTEGGSGRVLVNLRRVAPDMDVLYFVLTDVSESACFERQGMRQTKAYIREAKISIAKDNHELINEAGYLDGCVKNSDGKIYLFLRMTSREFDKELNSWKFTPFIEAFNGPPSKLVYTQGGFLQKILRKAGNFFSSILGYE